MNILPKKRWHVRTKENIARVRRDEAKAAQEEKDKKARIQKAETEARIDLLRERASEKYHQGRTDDKAKESKQPEKLEHVNLFAELEDGGPNAEHEAENKAKREKYEKEIGYLTYLGQDTNEATGATNWYDELPRRLRDREPDVEIQAVKKYLDDPMRSTGFAPSELSPRVKIEKSTKRKRDSDDSVDEKSAERLGRYKKKRESAKRKISTDKAEYDVDKLRAARLSRERNEKLRTEALLAKMRGEIPPKTEAERVPEPSYRQKYNSQFCPEIARQNVKRKSR